MSISAVSGSVQLYLPVKFQSSQPVDAPTKTDDASQTAAVKKQQDDNQQQQTANIQQVQSQNDNQISVNFLA